MAKEMLKAVMLILAVIVLALVVVNPGTQTQFVPTNVEISATEPEVIVSAVRDQDITDVWDDKIVLRDYRAGHYDIWVHDAESNNTVRYTTDITNEMGGAISDYAIVYMAREPSTTYDRPTFKYLSNLTEMVMDDESRVLTTAFEMEIYENNAVYHDYHANELRLFNITTLTATTIGEGVLANSDYFSIWGDYISIADRTHKIYYLYRISTESITAIESTLSTLMWTVINENYVYFSDMETTGNTIKRYNYLTGQTDTLVEEIASYGRFDAHGDWLTYMSGESGDYEIHAYNTVEDKIIDLGDGVWPHVWNGTVYYSLINGENNRDIWRIELTIAESPAPPPAPETPEEAIAEFIADYGLAILGIIAIIGVALFIEWRKYQWEHLKSKRGKTTAGLLISIALIVVLVLLLIA